MVKIITDPTVYVTARMQIDNKNLDRFLKEHTSGNWCRISDQLGENYGYRDSDQIPEIAGRLCYMSFDKPRPGGTPVYLDHIKEVGHGSVIEHTVFGFIFTGVSRSLSHELVRHRSGWSYSQLSQRYVEETDGCYVQPKDIQHGDEEEKQLWLDETLEGHLRYVTRVGRLKEKIKQKEYKRYVTLAAKTGTSYHDFENWWLFLPREDKTGILKRARQTARSRLPNAAETKIYATANVRAIRHFLEQRGAKAADTEIRFLANAVLAEMRHAAPLLFSDYVQTPIEGDIENDFEITTKYRKV